jgi:histidinol-phosphate phosphatase family domain/HAD-superfamily hydrolase, subfamily IIIA
MSSGVEEGRFHEELGIWAAVTEHVSPKARPALFLDRDGVIVEDPGYLSRVADLIVLSGAAEIIRLANRVNVPVVEVTNQSGIGRGYYGWKEFLEIEEALRRELGRAGAFIDAAFACPYHRDGIAPWNHPAHPARKPRPGMLLAARQFLNLDLDNSWIVGDKICDLQAGCNAGLRGGLLVLTGKGSAHRDSVREWKPENFEVRIGSSIWEAGEFFEL